MGWRGIWMTKNIEGTVDDDIAAKLAIGEGRQVNAPPDKNVDRLCDFRGEWYSIILGMPMFIRQHMGHSLRLTVGMSSLLPGCASKLQT